MASNLKVFNDDPSSYPAFMKMHKAFKRLTKRLGFIREYKRRQEFESNTQRIKRKRKEAHLRRIREEQESYKEQAPREPAFFDAEN